MATTVNARDVILQAANPRVLPVKLPTNVTVPTDQVDGLPALALNSKLLILKTTSQVFRVPKDGSGVTPASITLTPYLRNVSGTLNWLVISGTALLTTNADGSRTLTYANMGSNTVSIKAYVSDGGVEYSDTITLVKLSDGESTVNAILTNESHTIPADSNGLPTSYSGASTKMMVYVGATDDTSSWTFSKTDSIGVTSSISGNTVTVTEMQAAYTGAYIDITASRSGFPSITRRMSVAKAKAGTNGTNGSNGSSGSNGARGSFTLYVNGIAWDDNTANSAIWNASGSGGYRQIGDTVTISNGSSFAKTKYWSGGSWVDPGVVIDGNLLVNGTLSATKIYGGELSGVTMNINGNFRVRADGTSQLYTANLTRCTGSNGDAPGLPAMAITGYPSPGSAAPALRVTGNGSSAIEISGGSAPGIVQYGGSTNFMRTTVAVEDNAYDLGAAPNARWRQIYSASSTIVTSDQRIKTEVETSDLGLAFINDLRPVRYKLKVGSRIVKDIPVEPVEGEENPRPKQEVTEVPGKRHHYGMIAQEVRAALEKHGSPDASMWSLADPEDPDSQQALRYEGFIAPMIRAIQQMDAKIEALTEQVRLLTGK